MSGVTPARRPRHYALEILFEDNPERRRKLLEAAPGELRDLVDSHVRALWPKRQYRQGLLR